MRTRFTELVGTELPIVQAPMAGASDAALAAAVASAGALGSLPCAMFSADDVRTAWEDFRAASDRPVNLNFFCHAPPDADPAHLDAWRERLAAYYAELGIDAEVGGPSMGRTSFDEALTEVIEELAPTVVSFHFGLPADALVERVRATGARLMSSATTVAEARWLEDHGCDAVIAQGIEAGGHRGMFLTDDLATQVGTMAVQLGTAFLRCPEALTGELHREALAAASEDATVLTNVFTGRPARRIVNRVVAEVGPLTDAAPAFPTAVGALMPLRAAAEGRGSTDFTPLWSGQAARLARPLPAATLTRLLADEARQCLKGLVAGT